LFQEYDFILSCIPELVDDFNAKGHACYHLNHAFDPRVLAKLDVTQMPSVDFSFIGAIVKAAQHHLGREALMVQLVQATNLEVWSSIRPLKQKQQIKILAAQLAYDAIGVAAQLGASKERILKSSWFRMLSPAGTRLDFSSYIDQRISRRAHPAVFGLPMYQKLRDSKVTLNTHIDISPRSASNMRLFEAAGVGTCLLTDWRENLRDLYEPDIEVATYRSPNECIEKVHFLLQNQSEPIQSLNQDKSEL
jgi:spore maturation protein CgeB